MCSTFRAFQLLSCLWDTYNYDVLQTGPHKEKGRVSLNNVLAVEEVDSEIAGSKPNAFQVRTAKWIDTVLSVYRCPL